MREVAEILTPHDREYAIRLAECFPDDLGYSEHHRLAHYVRRYEETLKAREEELREVREENARLRNAIQRHIDYEENGRFYQSVQNDYDELERLKGAVARDHREDT